MSVETPGTRTRWARHPLMGQLVTDPATGKVGRLDGVLEFVANSSGRVVAAEAYVRPVDGSGWEWTARPDLLVAVTDGP
ncbi:hypothetical protein [Streptomyces mayteni]